VSDLGEIGSTAGAESVRIEIQPSDQTLQFWAFVAVTNNASQHVTVVTPN
jgi:hypothetical protein